MAENELGSMMNLLHIATLDAFFTCCVEHFGLLHLQLRPPPLHGRALQVQAPEGGGQRLLFVSSHLHFSVAALAQEAGCQGNVTLFPGKFDSDETQLHEVAIDGCGGTWSEEQQECYEHC